MFKQLLGDPNARKLRRYSPLVSDINILEEDISKLSDHELKSKTIYFREKLSNTKNEKEQTECRTKPRRPRLLVGQDGCSYQKLDKENSGKQDKHRKGKR